MCHTGKCLASPINGTKGWLLCGGRALLQVQDDCSETGYLVGALLTV